MEKKPYFSSALLPGIILGELAIIPHVSACNICCFVWVVLGGVLAALLFARENGSIKTGQGAIVGFIAGLVGAVVCLLGSIFSEFIFKSSPTRELQGLFGTGDLDPMVESVISGIFGNPWLMIFMTFISWILINSVMATLGGLIAGAIIERHISKKAAPMNPIGGQIEK